MLRKGEGVVEVKMFVGVMGWILEITSCVSFGEATYCLWLHDTIYIFFSWVLLLCSI